MKDYAIESRWNILRTEYLGIWEAKPFLSLSVAILGNSTCRTPNGDFNYFDPNTEFVSYCFSVIIGLFVTVVLAGPIVFRTWDLSRHEKGPLTLNGQLGKIAAVLVPVMYLTWFHIRAVNPSIAEGLIILGGFLVVFLHHVQEGRVTVSSAELQLYWLGILGFYCSIALNAYLASGVSQSWPVVFNAVLSFFIFVLELRGPDKAEGSQGFDDSNIFQKVSIGFANNLINKGSTEKLSHEDLPKPPAGVNAVNCFATLQANLDRYPETFKYRLLFAVLRSSATRIFFLVISGGLGDAISYIEPSVLGLFLGSLISYSSGESPLFPSFYFAVLLGVVPVVVKSLNNLAVINSTYTYAVSRTSLLTTIYRKAMNLSPGARENFEPSKIMNLINVDSEQLDAVAQAIPILVSAPLGIAISTWQLWRFLGPSMFSAVAVYAIVVPTTGYLSTALASLFPKMMSVKDERNKQTTNSLRNIKSLKLYAWEKPFYERILEIRDRELGIIRQQARMIMGMSFIWNMVGDLVASVVFVTYLWLREGVLSPEVVFPSLMLLTIATMPFMMLPSGITSVLRAVTSQTRINELLQQKDQDHENFYHRAEPAAGYDEVVVDVSHATISWNGSSANEKVVLKDIDFSASRGDFVCFTGRVGSGKTGLIKALAGELSVIGGHISIKGPLAYCSQEAWLQNMTLRENICFGLVFDREWYDSVLTACELQTDILQLPKGDETDVGERGISLSGGQKARVALARAVYSRSDVYLLDDVLSAVDEHVSAKLVSNLFSKRGLLANRTILLATNNVKVLSHASLIIAIQDKHIVEKDSFKDVVAQGEKSAVYRLIAEFGHADDLAKEAELIEDRKSGMSSHDSSSMDVKALGSPLKPLEIAHDSWSRKASDDNEEEESETVSLSVFKRYFTSLPLWYSWTMLLILTVSVVITNLPNIWLGYLTNQNLSSLYEARWYLTVYLGIVVVSGLIILLSQIWAQVVIALRVSRILHNRMAWNIFHAPMRFFDLTPLGRIINRFTGDIATIDSTFPTVVYYTVRSIMNIVMGLTTVVIGAPSVALIILPLIWLGNKYRQLYVPSSRKVSRMGSASNSPLLSHIEESLKGQSTVRTFDRSGQFIDVFDKRIDYWVDIAFIRQTIQQWLGFRVQVMASTLMLAAAVTIVILISQHKLSVGYAAVVIHFASRSGVMVRQTLTYLAQIEVSSVSLERIVEYIDVDQEAPSYIEGMTPPSTWPEAGQVSFNELSAKYTADGPDVLKSLSFTINGGEKIGIVGRTGSGKSSLTMTLFRILEASSGKIEIDHVNTSTLGLYDLRSRLSIIPQDAQIFDGSLRENLDPLRRENDARLWEVLELCHLKNHFQGLGTGLDTILADGGDSLSRGQSQLVCLGRALVHQAKVLVLDEATASVDVETDKVVQATIRKYFKDRTIITIAHRLNTIMDSDRIIVLDAGEIKEFDTPQGLLDSKGLFWGLYNAEKKEEH